MREGAAIQRELLNRYGGLPLSVRGYAALRIRMLDVMAFGHYLPERGRIVDVGCGYGVIAHYLALAAPEREVVGIDTDPDRIRYAQATLTGDARLSFMVGDARQGIPECDGILMSDFLHHLHVPEQNTLLMEIFRKLLPEGRLVILDVNPDHKPRWKWWMSWLADVLLYPFQEKNNVRHPGEFTQFLSGIGFRVTRVERPSALFAGIGYLCDRSS